MTETPARRTAPAPPQQQRAQPVNGRADGANLADILERVLDKGIVIAGDIQVNLLDIELLTIKIRLVVASVERAKEMGIDWWERDPTLSAGRQDLEDENRELRARVEALERGGHRDSDERELASRTDGEDPDDVADEQHDDAADADRSEEPDGGEPEEQPAEDDERPTRGDGRSGRAGRARSERETPARRKQGSKRSSTSRER